MDHNFCVRFGEVECELGVAQVPESGFVAWALRIESDGRRNPLVDKRGELLLVKALTAGEAIGVVRAHGAAAFGPEHPSAAALLVEGD